MSMDLSCRSTTGYWRFFWVLYNDEKYSGVTVHFIDNKIDHGDIIAQKTFPINGDESIHSLLLKITSLGSELILEAVNKIESGDYNLVKNDESRATYFSLPSTEQLLEFRKNKRFFAQKTKIC